MIRIIIVAGPRRGKGTLAEQLHGAMPARTEIHCGDPLSKVKEPRRGVHYLPEGLPFSGDVGAAAWVSREWFTMPCWWICEGHVMARALRRWNTIMPGRMPCDKIIVLDRPGFNATPKQDAMHLGVMTVWREIAPLFKSITEVRTK